MDNEEERKLQSKLNECALSYGQKKDVLEARDKLLRLRQDRPSDLAKAKAIVGTCQDMCPEHERYFRIETNQVSPFEMDFSNDPQGVPNEMKMVKEYRRSGADQKDPLANELRPIDVLERTMDYLCLEIVNRFETHDNIGEWFDFIWSRTRSIRKDITQQHLIDPKSVSLIEKCARFHLFCAYYLCEEDINDFDPKINEENLNNCLQTLKDFYHDLRIRSINCPNEAEFRAYDVLLNLGDGETLSELSMVKHFRSEIKDSPDVQLAINLYQSYDNGNYVKFFNLVRKADFFKLCILNRYINRFRVRALNLQQQAYTIAKSTILLPYPVDKIIELLVFDDYDELASFCDCIGMEYDKDNIYFQRKFLRDNTSVKKRLSNLIDSKLTTSPGQAILGLNNNQQINIQLFPVHSSFDANNRLVYEKNSFQINNGSSSSTSNSTVPSLPTFGGESGLFQNKYNNNNDKPISDSSNSLFNVTSFSFKSQFEKLASLPEQQQQQQPSPTTFPSISFTFGSTIQPGMSLGTSGAHENETIETTETESQDSELFQTKFYSRMIDQMKFEIFDSVLLHEMVMECCLQELTNRLIQKQVIKNEATDLYDQILKIITKELVRETFCKHKRLRTLMIQQSNHIFYSLLDEEIKSNIGNFYSNMEQKNETLKRNIKTCAINLMEEMMEDIFKCIAEKWLSDEIHIRDEQIKAWRRYSLQRKYWSKWYRYYLFQKRYKFYRETFPAAPVAFDHINNKRKSLPSTKENEVVDECPNIFLNHCTSIDDSFIKANDSLKRKLIYSRFTNNVSQTNQMIEENLKKKMRKSLTPTIDSHHHQSDDIEQIGKIHSLEKKYFKLWLANVRRKKSKRLRSEFPSAPSSIPLPTTTTSNRLNNGLVDNKNHHLTIIDPLIFNAQESIKLNLRQKLDDDFESTVAMIRKTLDDRRRKRQQLQLLNSMTKTNRSSS